MRLKHRYTRKTILHYAEIIPANAAPPSGQLASPASALEQALLLSYNKSIIIRITLLHNIDL